MAIIRIGLAYGMTPDRFLREHTVRQIQELLAYDSIEPIGDAREDYRAGLIAASVLNPWIKEGRASLGPLDLIPDWGGFRRRAKRAAKRVVTDSKEIHALFMGG